MGLKLENYFSPINNQLIETFNALAKYRTSKSTTNLSSNDRLERVYYDWKAGNITVVRAMELLGMKRNTFYRRVKEFESANSK